ncbi:hypothetical protein GX441_08060 [bacterium]|nr:hypothetical protein [bacterium]
MQTTKKKKITWTIWGAILGILLGTATSSAIAHLVKPQWLKNLLVEGVAIGFPEISTSLGFFSLHFGFSLRFTLLSGLFMIIIGGVMLLVSFREDS